MAMMGPQATGGFQAPEPYVPESAKAAGALYEAGITPIPRPGLERPSQATTIPIPRGGLSHPSPTAAEPAPFDPVAYRNQFKPDSGGLASVAQPAPFEPVNLTGAVPTFLPQRGGSTSRGQQMPSFYQQPMMAQPFSPMGYGPMGMGMNRFMNPYGGLGGMAYSFQNPNVNPNISAPLPFYATGSLPLYGQGSQFTAGQYQAPEPTKNPMVNAASSFIGNLGYY